jgi:hypothetical protein
MGIVKFIIYAIVYILGMPILTLLHELGHGIIGLMLTKGNVDIIIGNSNLNKKLRLKRLTIDFKGYENIFALTCGFVRCGKESSKFKLILINASGPVVSIIISITTYMILSKTHLSLNYVEIHALNAVFWYSFSAFIMTIIPMRYEYYPYKGYFSDGYSIMSLINKRSK